MKALAIGSSFLIGMLAVVSCSLEATDESAADELRDEGSLGEQEQPITKGKPGAVNGAADYCNTINTCAAGEGDCDKNAQCGAGLICAPNNGPKFGFPSDWDVCVVAHCANRVLDGDETGIDCGGSCGSCSSCVGAPGGEGFCRGCQCASGQGDCDSNAECANGLICAPDNGPMFSLPLGYDVCVPAHCANGVLDAADGETSVDEGGPCGARASSCSGTPGTTTFCVGCKCGSGEGDCDNDGECGSGLVCGTDNGLKFGLPKAYDVCVPAHCTNRALDAASGETGIDVGGPCGTAPNVCGDGAIGGSEVCDDGVNDGLLCNATCSAATEVAWIRVDCDPGATVGASLAGNACVSFPGLGASYLSLLTSGIQVTLYSNDDCTGETLTVTSVLDFCGSAYDQGSGMNDNVQSARVTRL